MLRNGLKTVHITLTKGSGCKIQKSELLWILFLSAQSDNGFPNEFGTLNLMPLTIPGNNGIAWMVVSMAPNAVP
jgi:hypothetical protein